MSLNSWIRVHASIPFPFSLYLSLSLSHSRLSPPCHPINNRLNVLFELLFKQSLQVWEAWDWGRAEHIEFIDQSQRAFINRKRHHKLGKKSEAELRARVLGRNSESVNFDAEFPQTIWKPRWIICHKVGPPPNMWMTRISAEEQVWFRSRFRKGKKNGNNCIVLESIYLIDFEGNKINNPEASPRLFLKLNRTHRGQFFLTVQH